jgi:hypothetical protein
LKNWIAEGVTSKNNDSNAYEQRLFKHIAHCVSWPKLALSAASSDTLLLIQSTYLVQLQMQAGIG